MDHGHPLINQIVERFELQMYHRPYYAEVRALQEFNKAVCPDRPSRASISYHGQKGVILRLHFGSEWITAPKDRWGYRLMAGRVLVSPYFLDADQFEDVAWVLGEHAYDIAVSPVVPEHLQTDDIELERR